MGKNGETVPNFREPKAEQAALKKGDHFVCQDGGITYFGKVIELPEVDTSKQHRVVKLYSSGFPDGFVSIRNVSDLWPIDEATFEWIEEIDWQISAMPADLWANVRDRLAQLDEVKNGGE